MPLITTKPLLLLSGALLLAYSYACFCKPDWVAWLSVAPVLEKKNPIRPFILAAHGIIAGIAGLTLVIIFLCKVFAD